MKNRVFKNLKMLLIGIAFAILFCVNASAFSTNLKEIKVLDVKNYLTTKRFKLHTRLEI